MTSPPYVVKAFHACWQGASTNLAEGIFHWENKWSPPHRLAVGVDTHPPKSSTTRGYGAEKVLIELRHAGVAPSQHQWWRNQHGIMFIHFLMVYHCLSCLHAWPRFWTLKRSSITRPQMRIKEIKPRIVDHDKAPKSIRKFWRPPLARRAVESNWAPFLCRFWKWFPWSRLQILEFSWFLCTTSCKTQSNYK